MGALKALVTLSTFLSRSSNNLWVTRSQLNSKRACLENRTPTTSSFRKDSTRCLPHQNHTARASRDNISLSKWPIRWLSQFQLSQDCLPEWWTSSYRIQRSGLDLPNMPNPTYKWKASLIQSLPPLSMDKPTRWIISTATFKQPFRKEFFRSNLFLCRITET